MNRLLNVGALLFLLGLCAAGVVIWSVTRPFVWVGQGARFVHRAYRVQVAGW